MLTVNPFVSTSSHHFAPLTRDGHFVLERNSTMGVPALTWFKVQSNIECVLNFRSLSFILQDAATVALLDLTREDSLDWFKGRLTELLAELGQDGGREEDVLFYLNTGNSHHTPTYFQVRKTTRFLANLCALPFLRMRTV